MTRWRLLLWPGLATLVALAILLSLGNWQLQRKTEKEAMLGALERALTADPLPLLANRPDVRSIVVSPVGAANPGAGALRELSRVTLTGAFLPGRSVPVRATLPATPGGLTSGIGFFWMTPLQVEGGATIFINRGFVSSGGDWKAPAIPTPTGPQTITGLMRLPERGQTFTPADNPAKGEYFSRDPQLMAKAVGLDPATVGNFFIDAERLPGNVTPPVGIDPREMIARIPNNHLQYAFTWFAFALALLGVFGFFARGRLRDQTTA
jgi:surfeit locus 1 family protein